MKVSHETDVVPIVGDIIVVDGHWFRVTARRLQYTMNEIPGYQVGRCVVMPEKEYHTRIEIIVNPMGN